MKKTGILLGGIAALVLAVAPNVRAADHGDGPNVGPDQGADIADIYAFLDPNDVGTDLGKNVVLIGTSRGFIVPSENGNFGTFDPNIRYTFAIENTGDAIPDLFIDVDFTPRAIKSTATLPQTTTIPAQDAVVSLRGAVPKEFAGKKGKFDPVPVYQPSLATVAPAQTDFIKPLLNTANQTPGITFFAGIADDPFFFDIPGFNRFVASVVANKTTVPPAVPPAIDFTTLDRARDSFAGYNVLGISIKVPVALLKNAKPKAGESAKTKLGINFSTSRGSSRTVKGITVASGAPQQVDRMGVPGVNVAFIGFNRKNDYNGASTLDDAKGAFFPDIAATLLTNLGTSPTIIYAPTGLSYLDTLAFVAGIPSVANGTATGVKFPLKDKTKFGLGDFLRLETDIVANPTLLNTGTKGGTNASAGFPNGRRPADDVIDTVLFLVTNGGLTTGDKVPASDVAPQNTFPFLALPQQPREGAGNIDDNTRN